MGKTSIVNHRLVAFLYILGRDHLPLGKIEEIMVEHVEKGEIYNFSNGALEHYAKHISRRLNENA